MFPQQFICRGGDVPWPYCLWGYLKNKVFISKPRTMEELKRRIKEEVAAILEQMTRQVMEKLRKTGAVFEKWWGTSE
jgi:hypothetical protein